MITLVLLPGLDGTGALFEGFVAALGPDIQVIKVSYPPDRPLDYADLESVARSCLPLDEPFFLLAESFSGPIAVSIAASSPPGLLGLILCCTFARNPLPWLAPARHAIGAVPVRLAPLALIRYLTLGRFSSTPIEHALSDSLALLRPSVVRARVRAVLSVNVTPLLRLIRVPALYLRASEDRIIRRSASELIASVLPDIEVAEFEAPHFLLQAAPEQAAFAVVRFMQSRLSRYSPPAPAQQVR